MKKEAGFIEKIVMQHTEKLTHWYELLREIMPDYFFKTFSTQHIEDILPLLFNIENETGIQRIEREDSITLIYLKSETNNLLATSRMMRSYNISDALVHESKQKIVVNNTPRILVVEHFTLTSRAPMAGEPLFSFKELSAEYKKKFNKLPAELKELYSRINWLSVADLNCERLVDRLKWALETQDKDYLNVGIDKTGPHELRLTLARSSAAQRGGFYYKIIEALNLTGFNIERAYFRDMTRQDNPHDFNRMPVTIGTLYLTSDRGVSVNSKNVEEMLRELKVLNWTDILDVFHRELVTRQGFSINDTNLVRAAAEFVHAQLSFVDKNAYNHQDIFRFMAIYPAILQEMINYFKIKFDPAAAHNDKKENATVHRIEKAISDINTGMYEKDTLVKTIFRSVLNFFINIRKTNFYVENKASLAFRMDPAFMTHYEAITENYQSAFPKDRPFGVFYFFRDNAIGFQVRFADIARGGWRTVVPKNSANELENRDNYEFAKDEIFREVFILAHTQHMKNKDIYEGGSKMITLLNLDESREFESTLFEAQRAICAAFVSLINYDAKNKLRDSNIVDYLGQKEIIEIGPDENMFDIMIEWMSSFAEQTGYTLGAGLISGKHDRGINHKEFGVTSFGVHQFLLRTLQELNINPLKDEFSIKISGGPFGDVAGNEMRLLLRKEDGKYLYPNLKIVAITDGPVALYDPAGINRDELATIVLKKNLDAFNPEKLQGENACMVFSKPLQVNGLERHRMVVCKNGRIQEKNISRDEFMKIFQNNIYNYADVFIPCGGRPSTINSSNWQNYSPEGKNSSLAIVEGANSFITPDAREKLQDVGVLIVKDASANKCGVITSSYEILSGLILDEQEFVAAKKELVVEIMNKLRNHACREAEWLFTQFKVSGRKMTELTELLSRQINAKNTDISTYLDKHPELIQDKIILEHLPQIFQEKYSNRLNRIPTEYKKAIVAVELATRIVYRQSDSLDQEIKSVL
ncbi:MAG: NAD-glutamate dehydrogenase domain-containing protein [Victivallaceae bacterium]